MFGIDFVAVNSTTYEQTSGVVEAGGRRLLENARLRTLILMLDATVSGRVSLTAGERTRIARLGERGGWIS